MLTKLYLVKVPQLDKNVEIPDVLVAQILICVENEEPRWDIRTYQLKGNASLIERTHLARNLAERHTEDIRYCDAPNGFESANGHIEVLPIRHWNVLVNISRCIRNNIKQVAAPVRETAMSLAFAKAAA